MRTAILGGVAAVALLLTGCPTEEELPDEIQLYTMTVAPAARTAAMVNTDLEHSVTMSRGVALAIGCWDTCTSACEAPTFTVASPEIASVLPVYRASGGAPTYALVARTAGTTQLTVANACATQTYSLTVADDQP